ncbi:MAG: MarR family transcriptional regulator [Burkholderiaceae bacterium]
MIESYHLRFIQQLGRSYRAFIAGFEAHTGHSMARWRILVLLDARKEMSQKALALELGVDPAALTRQLKALELVGWVERHSDPQDARLTNAVLTEAGRQTVLASIERRNEYIEGALGHLSEDELGHLSDMLVTLEERLLANRS